ncbi:MAG TPA: hypothetical protein VGU65_10760 [Frateuria sp.]|uniref:hypothetical protein n=1 Tax=Frateuria sp. TaxID=2211372 RepID=UPI002DEFEBE1|nr:hypothetical protein [Frateuria sp.]
MGKLSATALLLCAAVLPSAAHADTDACSLLAPAQVGAAVGVPVSEGKHVTPSFVKTCTWTASGTSAVKYVTLYLQTAAAYEGGKQMAVRMAAAGAKVTPASVGDDGYYFVAGDQVGLLVKKGDASFKVAVYATLPVAKKEAMELALAQEVVGKL